MTAVVGLNTLLMAFYDFKDRVKRPLTYPALQTTLLNLEIVFLVIYSLELIIKVQSE